MEPLNLSKEKFTNGADIVNSDSGIFNPAGSEVKTLKGDDQINGNKSINSAFGLEVFAGVEAINAGAISAGDITAKATINADGINNKGTIATHSGSDLIKGSGTAQVIAQASAVSNAIAYANKLNTGAIAATFANINIDAIANGINNSGKINTGNDSDSLNGGIDGSVTAIAKADAKAIVRGIAKASVTQELNAFADAIAVSLANATIISTGIKNVGGEIYTREGEDKISAIAISDSNTLSEASAETRTASNPENQALATAVAEAIATAKDKAIAIDNTKGIITTSQGRDTIEATANAEFKAIAIENSQGTISTGTGRDTIKANATGQESYGIFGGTIKTGNGNDRIEASSFGGGVNIDMGEGDDFVEGFGSATVSGGDDFDTLSLGYRFEDFKISFGSNDSDDDDDNDDEDFKISFGSDDDDEDDDNDDEDFKISFGSDDNDDNQLIFKRDGITMNTTEFEKFVFNNRSFNSYDDLVDEL